MSSVLKPKDFHANRRFKFSQALPESVEKAMESLASTFRETAELIDWDPPGNALYSVEITLWQPTLQGDIDGPVKRMMDAAFRGLRQWKPDYTWINDGRVVRLRVDKDIVVDQSGPNLAIRVGCV